MLSAQCKYLGIRAFRAIVHIRVRDDFSYSDAAYICIFWKENEDPCHSFDHVLHSSWRDCLGDQQRANPSVSNHCLLLRSIPDSLAGITVSLLFIVVDRSGCFAVSDQPTISEILASATEAIQDVNKFQVPVSYHMGVRLRLCLPRLSDYTDMRPIVFLS
jgi:hypothetical protein